MLSLFLIMTYIVQDMLFTSCSEVLTHTHSVALAHRVEIYVVKMFVVGKHVGSDSDSFDDDDGIEAGFHVASGHDDGMEKDVIAASKLSTPVSFSSVLYTKEPRWTLVALE